MVCKPVLCGSPECEAEYVALRGGRNRFLDRGAKQSGNSVEAGNGGRTEMLLPDSFLAGEKNSQNQEFSGGLHRCRQNGDFQK